MASSEMYRKGEELKSSKFLSFLIGLYLLEKNKMTSNQGELRLRTEVVLRAFENLSLPYDQFNALGLFTYYGEESVESIKLGLSRKINASEDDIRYLISQWNSGDIECFYQGSTAELLLEKDVAFFAVSYRHDHKSRWNRNGTEEVCKMHEIDEELLVKSALVLCKVMNKTKAIVWCDRVISTRFKYERQDFPWYMNGMLPYVVMPTVFLSNHVPKTELESRIWIRAERSLSRISRGSLTTEGEISQWKLNYGKNAEPDESLKNLAQNILSGLWPADTGYWNDDYRQMKQWALRISCSNRIFPLQLHEVINQIDNINIIQSMRILSVPPEGAEEEPSFWINDVYFYLKAYAWNLWVYEEWDLAPNYVSHFMGLINPGCDFTWWSALNDAIVLGTLVNENESLHVIGVRESSGYRVYRRRGKSNYYINPSNSPGKCAKEMVHRIMKYDSASVLNNLKWSLLYSSSDRNIPNIIDPLRVLFEEQWEKNVIQAECLLPPVYHRLTKKLLISRIKKENIKEAEEKACKKIYDLTKIWNQYITENFSRSVKVCDCHNGPVWLEGVNDSLVTFGYLTFITEALIIDRVVLNFSAINLPSEKEALQYLRQAAKDFPLDRQLVTSVLFSDSLADEDASNLSSWDISRLIMAGGFSSQFNLRNFSAFLAITAQSKGYWSTRTVCRNGKAQVRFYNGQEVRILQWPSDLKDFTSIGLVHPNDYQMIEKIAGIMPEWDDVPEFGTPYVHTTFLKPNMTDTISRQDCISFLPASCLQKANGEHLFLVDMVTTTSSNSVPPNNITVEGDKGGLVLESDPALLGIIVGKIGAVVLNVFRIVNKLLPMIESIVRKLKRSRRNRM